MNPHLKNFPSQMVSPKVKQIELKKIFFNGRFLTRPLTGVQRTAYEIILALDELIEQDASIALKYSFMLIYSGDIMNPIILKNIKLKQKGFLKGNLWEQIELPIITTKGMLVSMCSISTLFKRKQIVIVHDASFAVNKQYFSKLFVKWYNFAIPFLGIISRKIITVSNFSKHELIKHSHIEEKKIAVIYNAADHILRYNDPEPDFIERICNLKPYCLAVSSLGENKNFHGLSMAIKGIDFEKFNMVIAGSAVSVLNNFLKADNIIYLGYVTNEQLKYLYANASLFIFPSFYEGFGIPPLEAMISGCPVIASETSSIPEILEDACAYLNPADTDDMAKKISLVINNPKQLEDLRIKGYRQASKYSWKKSSKHLYEVIDKYND